MIIFRYVYNLQTVYYFENVQIRVECTRLKDTVFHNRDETLNTFSAEISILLVSIT